VSQQELLIRVVVALEELGVPYMLTGSLAASFYGAPRATQDVDVVAELKDVHLAALIEAFPSPRFYLEQAAMADALRRGTMFNLLETRTGDKVDFWMLTAAPFDVSRFRRKLSVRLFGRAMVISSPEDLILVKLEWAKKAGGSNKQISDVLQMWEVQGSALDQQYIDRWAATLDVTELWENVRGTGAPGPT
jgi:hypothetical protein